MSITQVILLFSMPANQTTQEKHQKKVIGIEFMKTTISHQQLALVTRDIVQELRMQYVVLILLAAVNGIMDPPS